jgi:pilus assembly protein Flp/PilA
VHLTDAGAMLRQEINRKENIMRSFFQYVAVRRFLQSDDGVTAIEYGLIAALVAIVIITAVTLLGTNLSSVFNKVATTV